jgi:hypothetical protein
LVFHFSRFIRSATYKAHEEKANNARLNNFKNIKFCGHNIEFSFELKIQ